MAIVVSEYGKVLGLVTMDDLLAQIFGVIRDERTELQASTKLPRARTPVRITPLDTGPVTKEEDIDELRRQNPGDGREGRKTDDPN